MQSLRTILNFSRGEPAMPYLLGWRTSEHRVTGEFNKLTEILRLFWEAEIVQDGSIYRVRFIPSEILRKVATEPIPAAPDVCATFSVATCKHMNWEVEDRCWYDERAIQDLISLTKSCGVEIVWRKFDNWWEPKLQDYKDFLFGFEVV